MNEVMYNLYAVTGTAAYHATGLRFNHWQWTAPLAIGDDDLDASHGNNGTADQPAWHFFLFLFTSSFPPPPFMTLPPIGSPHGSVGTANPTPLPRTRQPTRPPPLFGAGGNHANTHIPEIIGAARGYEVSGNLTQKNITTNFFDIVTSAHAWATGGSNDGEHWTTPMRMGDQLNADTEESCTQYNMLKVARHLFLWTASPRFADYYER